MSDLIPGASLTGTYDPTLVVLSLVTAAVASYVALDMAGRVSASGGGAQILWIVFGASTMGIGIWSMHFIGMLAFTLPVAMRYHLPVVAASIAMAVVASALALWLVSRPRLGRPVLLAGGGVMGLAVAGMHFTGMAAIDLPARFEYSPGLLAASILIAVVASTVALALAHAHRDDLVPNRMRHRVASALVMGSGLFGMQFVGMRAANFRVIESPGAWVPSGGLDPHELSNTLVVSTFVILGTTLIAAALDRRLLAVEVSKRQQQQTFDVALSSLGDFIYVFDRRGRFAYANQALLTLFGITLDSIVGKSFADLQYPPDLASRLANQIQRVIETGQTVRDETPFTFPNGEFGVYEYRLHPVSSAGSVQFVAGSSRDITDLRRRAETTQVQARQQAAIAGLGLQALAGATAARLMNEAVRIVAETLSVPLVKVQAVTAEGRRLKVVAGVGWHDGIVGRAEVGAGADSQEGYTLMTHEPVLCGDLTAETRFSAPPLLIDHGVVSGVTVPIAGRDTAWGVLAAHTVVPRRFSHDDGMFVQAVANVLAEAIRREDAEVEAAVVRARLEQHADLLDKARDAIVVRDLDQRVTYINRSAERVFGWSAAEALGRSAIELFPADPDAVEAATATLLARGEWAGELIRRTRSGTAVAMDCRWTLVRDRAGAPQTVLMIESDITERRKLEQQFLRAQRLESIGTLAGGIAHDLNNVLAPIMMGINLLREDERDPVKLEMLDTINASTQRGADMVRQVLLFARGVDGQRVQVRVPQLLQDVEKIIRDTFPKNVQVISSSEANLPQVAGDPTQLHQVLINLCVNARDAMPGGGSLKIAARRITLDAQYAALEGECAPGPYVEITVADTGTGIPAESLDKVFEPFFTTKEVGTGTGLGLSTSLAIVRSHGGFIRAYSEPGLGTTFRLCLPVSEAAASAPGPAEHVELPRGRGELLLVVDDEASVRQITGQTLEAFGYRVVLAADGAEAVAVYATRRDEIAAVITDMMMPVMDGPAAIHALLRINPQVRIVAASGLHTAGRVAEAAAAGVSLFLPKPYSADALLKMVRKALQEPQ